MPKKVEKKEGSRQLSPYRVLVSMLDNTQLPSSAMIETSAAVVMVRQCSAMQVRPHLRRASEKRTLP